MVVGDETGASLVLKNPSFQWIHILINVYIYYEYFRTHAL